MAAHPIKNKLQPFKILVTLMFADAPWIMRDADNFVDILTGPMSRAMLISLGRLQGYLTYLEEQGYLTTVHRSTGIRSYRLVPPPSMIFATEALKSHPCCVECSCECQPKGECPCQPEGTSRG